MRTNIEIDDELMAEAKRISGNKTKKQVVEEALKAFIRLGRQEKIREFRGKIKWEGNLDEMREMRDFNL